MGLVGANHSERRAEKPSDLRMSAVRRARGMLAGIQPERRLSDELVAERRAEAQQALADERAGR